jgi:hypothetical protein
MIIRREVMKTTSLLYEATYLFHDIDLLQCEEGLADLLRRTRSGRCQLGARPDWNGARALIVALNATAPPPAFSTDAVIAVNADTPVVQMRSPERCPKSFEGWCDA